MAQQLLLQCSQLGRHERAGSEVLFCNWIPPERRQQLLGHHVLQGVNVSLGEQFIRNPVGVLCRLDEIWLTEPSFDVSLHYPQSQPALWGDAQLIVKLGLGQPHPSDEKAHRMCIMATARLRQAVK